jgi:hypothetical protein
MKLYLLLANLAFIPSLFAASNVPEIEDGNYYSEMNAFPCFSD